MNTPSSDYARTRTARPGKFHKGLDGAAHRLAGRLARRRISLDALRTQADRILALSEKNHAHPAAQLDELVTHHRREHRRHRTLPDGARDEALGLIVTIARRHTGLRPHPEQVMAALAILEGWLVEMATGEGKTLAIALAAILPAWRGDPCLVITANDYLAARDSQWLTPFYEACGTTAGCVTATMPPDARTTAYAAGITYTTIKESVADFLRDRLALGKVADPQRRLIRRMLGGARTGLVMRGLHTAIIDEADNAMIDEAVTPLIISRPRDNAPLVEATRLATGLVENLRADEDYTVDLRHKEIRLTARGREAVAREARRLPGIWNGTARRGEIVRQALQAREFYKPGQQYVVEEGKVVIVDEFTGRLMPQRSWQQGLHQAVESREGLDLTPPNETMARLSFQRFFRLFAHLSGVTGTAREAAEEFWQIYRLPVVAIPHHRPCIRREMPDRLYLRAEDKWSDIVERVRREHASGRPILIGTRNVAASEHLARLLDAASIPYRLLNAVRHSEEASIIALAGEPGNVTIATNMAGRGTDIRLAPGVAKNGGLLVLATERHESRRIDRQLFGRAARQGDPGAAQAYMSLDDELIRRYVPSPVRRALLSAEKRQLPGHCALLRAAMRHAQRASERAAHTQRANVLRHDTWLDESLGFAGG